MGTDVTDPGACLVSGPLPDPEAYAMGVRKPGFPAFPWALTCLLFGVPPSSEPSFPSARPGSLNWQFPFLTI